MAVSDGVWDERRKEVDDFNQYLLKAYVGINHKCCTANQPAWKLKSVGVPERRRLEKGHGLKHGLPPAGLRACTG